jgi:hypothetical protein
MPLASIETKTPRHVLFIFVEISLPVAPPRCFSYTICRCGEKNFGLINPVSYCSILFCTNSILSHGVNVKANRSESLLSKARGQRQTPPSPPDQSGSGRASNAAKANDADGGLTALYLRDDINCRHSLQRSDVRRQRTGIRGQTAIF